MPKPVTITELANELGVDPAGLVEEIERSPETNWYACMDPQRRVIETADGAYGDYTLTPAGRDALIDTFAPGLAA